MLTLSTRSFVCTLQTGILAILVGGCSSDKISIEDLEAAAANVDVSAIEIDEDAEAPAAMLDLEKSKLKFGFIKLTDCAPIVIAKEKGYFDDEGLNVEVEAQTNWKVLLDRVIDGQLDGAHMLAGQPIGATIGVGTPASIITAYSLDYNGNGITVSNEVWAQMQENDPKLKSEKPEHPISADSLKPIVASYKEEQNQPFPMGMVFPVSTHNYEIRYWLAAASIHPGLYTESDITGVKDADVQLSVTPPPEMPKTLEAGTIKGYCVGEPWNQKAVVAGIGVPVTTNYDIWKNNPEKVFGVSKAWAEKNPSTHLAVIKALIRAGKWLDETDDSGKLVNRQEAAKILSNKDYVGAEEDLIDNSMTGTFVFQETDVRERRASTSSSNTTRVIRTTAIAFGSSRRCAAGGRLPNRSQRAGTLKRQRKSTSLKSTVRLLRFLSVKASWIQVRSRHRATTAIAKSPPTSLTAKPTMPRSQSNTSIASRLVTRTTRS